MNEAAKSGNELRFECANVEEEPLSLNENTAVVLTKRTRRRLSVLLFVAYVLILFKLLFFKLTLNFSAIAVQGNDGATFQSLLAASNFIPFYRIFYYASGEEPYLVGLFEIGGNVAVFVPMGFFLPLFFKPINDAKRLIAVAAALSLGVEILQLITTTGEFDIDDVLLNAAGGWIGYWLFRWSKIRK